MLRDYQIEPVRKAVEFFRNPDSRPALMVLPTSWGKSILAAHVALSIPDGDSLLVVQPSKELLEQNYEKYMALCGAVADAAIYSAAKRKKDIAKITFATIGSIKELGAQFRELGFTKMLVDEAHLYPRREESMIGQFLSDSGITHVLGITATPLKMETVSSTRLVQKKDKDGNPVVVDGEPEMKKVFDGYSKLVMLTNPSNDGTFFRDIIHVSQVSEMTGNGYWSKLVYDRQPYETRLLRLNSSGSEFSEKSSLDAYEYNHVHRRIIGALNYYADRRHCLVFVPSVEEAERVAADYPGAEVVSGKTPKKERERIISEFRSGKIRVLVNCLVLSVGFDYPEIDCIILASSTASVARYYQICGRGVRVHEGKANCLIVDLGGNIDRFGKIEDIVFENDGIWRMYGSNGKLLSGVPIECINCYSKEDVIRMQSLPRTPFEMPVGKYKGKELSMVPLAYLRWFLCTRSANNDSRDRFLLDNIRLALENDIRDTTGDSPLLIMPYGIHQEKFLIDVPKGYLRWVLENTKWTKMNDSLRRGILLALQEDRLFDW